MKAFVTGATGFIGSAVARKLLERGDEVRALVRPGSDRRNLDGLEIELVEGDLGSADTYDHSLEGCNALFHIAADYRLWVRDPDAMYAANVDASRAIVLAAAKAGVSRAVYTSSVATLGINKDQTPGDEDTPVSLDDMVGHYKRSKFLAEQAVGDAAREVGMPIVIVNPSTPLGPRDIKPTPTGRLVVEAARGHIPAYVDTGLNVVHVDDVAAGIVLAGDKGRAGERYVLGGTDMTLRQILRAVSKQMGRRPAARSIPRWPVYPIAIVAEAAARMFGNSEPFVTVEGLKMSKKYMFFSSDKACRELGYQARPAEQAIADAVAWFCSNGYL